MKVFLVLLFSISMGMLGVYIFGIRVVNKAIDDADSKFHYMIADAKNQTADPCGMHHVRLIKPPNYSSKRGAVLVVGGQEISGDNINDLVFEAREPIPGEHAIRVAILPAAPEFQEIIWIAHGTQACQAGLGEAIKRFAISGGREGSYGHPNWPTPSKKK